MGEETYLSIPLPPTQMTHRYKRDHGELNKSKFHSVSKLWMIGNYTLYTSFRPLTKDPFSSIAT